MQQNSGAASLKSGYPERSREVDGKMSPGKISPGKLQFMDFLRGYFHVNNAQRFSENDGVLEKKN